MWKVVAVLALAALAIIAGHIADNKAATHFADMTGTPLMYAGIRG